MSVPRIQRYVAVLWPSFIAAAAATAVLVLVFDPVALMTALGDVEVGRLGVYTTAFFAFWVLAATSSLLTAYFLRPTRGAGRDQPAASP